jgi:HEAT repeat protein
MRLVDRLYDWLLQGPSPGCDRILTAGLAQAEPAWAERMMQVLLLRGRDASWAGLIGHYDRLTPEIRELLRHPDEHVQAGIAMALKSPAREARVNALRALGQQPGGRMAYLLPLALRDPSGTVRGMAAEIFHKVADSFLDQPVPAFNAAAELRRTYAEQRRQLAMALEEALRTFDLHNRIEILEASLWFSSELNQALWRKLTSLRSHAGLVVREQIAGWDHPRLAHFLLSALKRPAWRRIAAQVLRGWKTVPQVTALLSQDTMLEQPLVRRYVGSVRRPQWFTQTDDALTELEPHLRRHAPQWVCAAGYTERERLLLLARWLRAPDLDLRSAVVHALAKIDTPEARALLRRVGRNNSPLASFARWCAEACDTETVDAALQEQTPVDGPVDDRAEPERSGCHEPDADCTMLWLACRRTAPNERGQLVATLREHAGVWAVQLRSFLRSPDPRDRVLALHVISVPPLARQFREDVRPLLNDPVEGVRELAGRLMRAASQSPAPEAGPLERVPRSGGPPSKAFERARQELRDSLERLSAGQADATDADLMARVRDLLREIYAEQFEPQPVAGPQEQS